MEAFQFTVMCTRPANSLMTRQSTKVPAKKLPFAFLVALMAIIFTGSTSVCDSVLNGNQVGVRMCHCTFIILLLERLLFCFLTCLSTDVHILMNDCKWLGKWGFLSGHLSTLCHSYAHKVKIETRLSLYTSLLVPAGPWHF